MMKRYLAVAMAAVFMMLPSLTVEASGEETENINTNVYQVDLPMNTKGIFDFILDPQGLINKTDAAAYDGRKFEPGSTVFFKRTDGKVKEDYSSSSDHVTIVNKSSIPVDVSVNIKVSDAFAEKIALTDDKTFKNDTDASLYLALKDKDGEMPIGREGLKLDVTVDAAPDGAYEYSLDEESEKYTYKLKEDSSNIQFDEYSFQLTGAANGKGDWTKLADVVPEIEVEWKVSPREGVTERRDAILPDDMNNPEEGVEKEEAVDEATEQDTVNETKEETTVENNAPSIAKNECTLSAGNPVSVDVDLGSGDTAASQVISVRRKDSGEELLNVLEEVTYKDGKILFSREWVDKYIEGKENMSESLIIQFDDVNSTEAEITLKK